MSNKDEEIEVYSINHVLSHAAGILSEQGE